MSFHLFALGREFAAVVAGGGVGLAFGALQQAALRRHEERQRLGRLASGWSLMPGAGVRVAYLVIALVAIQAICPLLFSDGTQWLVSGGLLLGYGWTLQAELRRRLRAHAR